MKTAVFVYGSLLNPDSAARTLGRPVEHYREARLPGARFVWGSPQWVRLVGAEEKFIAYSANALLNASMDDSLLGMLIEVSPEEIGRLLVRENGYSLINITRQLSSADVKRAYIFSDLRADARMDGPVMAAYHRRITDGVLAQGESFSRAYLDQIPPVARLIDGDFEFADAEHQLLV
jgi:hypothetical protein